VQTGFESLPDALQVASKEDNVLVANIDVRAGQFSGLMTVCVPLHALEPFLQEKPAAVRQGARLDPSEQAAQRASVETSLRVASLPVTARFPVFTMRARDAAALSVGQVIHTGFPLDVPIEVHVNGRRRFVGVPGQVRRSMGIRITAAAPAGAAEPKERAARARVV
jgi:flagellar motor switch protein FliM